MKSLREMRTEKNITQEQVARAVNISLRHYHKIEKGDSMPTVSLALQICSFLKENIYDVEEWNKNPEQK